MRLEGKVALISGAAAGLRGELMGFGGASAWMFLREGARVMLGDINEELGERSASQMRDDGYDAAFVRLDVTREQDWIDAVKATVDAFGKLDVLVNNAGIGGQQNVEDTTVEIWDGQMNVHAKGAFLGMKHARPEMRRAGGGSIVNISSINGLIGSPTSTAYHAAKAAVRLLTKNAAMQYAGESIRVNSVHPGYALTPMTESSFSVQEHFDSRVALVPMGRMCSADEIANGILYLASDESSFVTGSELVIDGGMTAQ